MYKAILLKDKENDAEITSINLNDLPSGDVTVQIEFSTINYKDSLAIVNKIINDHNGNIMFFPIDNGAKIEVIFSK